ncbi:MAG: thioredoxin domain-containing protein, partial [Phaeodactylibacter sp.]|nr:thioredoxin domain-containing protein [Phaeodactylibacter sp.]
ALFFYTSDLDPPLVVRKKELADNVIASSNSIMARNLLALGQYFYDESYLDKARQMLNSMWAVIAPHPQPNFYANWSALALELLQPPYEEAVLGPEAASKRAALETHYLPNVRLLGGTSEGSLELLKDKLQEGETLIYVCQNKVCKFPVADVDEALKLME